MVFKFEDLVFFVLAILSSHSNIMTDIAVTHELMDRNFGEFATTC